MKKIFALTLAAVMATGMTSVAFASTATKDARIPVLAVLPAADAAIGTPAPLTAANMYYDADDANGDYETAITSLGQVTPGSKVIIPIATWIDVKNGTSGKIDGATDSITKTTEDDVKGYRVYTDWAVGKLDVAPVIAYVKYPVRAGDTTTSYGYAIVVETPKNITPKPVDLAGTITLAKTSTEGKNPSESIKRVDFDSTISRGLIANFTGDFGASKGAWVDFDDAATEIDIEFGEEAIYNVNVSGQSNLNLRFNTKYNSTFGAMYAAANIDFLNFEASPVFNRTGTLFINADEDNKFIYEVTADGAKSIDVEFDEDMSAYKLKTRKLTSYAISDHELEEGTADTTTSAPTTSAPTAEKPNPDTGR